MTRSTGCLLAFGLPLTAIAIYAGAGAMRLHSVGAPRNLVFVYACVALALGVAGLGSLFTALGTRRMTAPSADPRRISDQSHATNAVLWGFALMWNAVAAPVLVFVPDAIRKGNPIAYLAFAFPLIGIVLIANAIRLTLRALRFRESTLVLDTLPAPIGGTLRGHVEVPHPLTSLSAMTIQLVALSRQRSGNTTHDAIVAHEIRELDPSLIRRTAEGAVIPIEIAVPTDAPPSDTTDANNKLYWRLSIDADVPGIDYSASFDVPVEKTAFSDFRPHGTPAPAGIAGAPQSLVERQTPEGRELYFPRFRARSSAMLSLLFSVAWIAAAIFFYVVGVPRFFVGAMALLAFPIVASMLELFFESRTIVIGPQNVLVRRRMLSKRERVIPHATIESVRAVMGPTSNHARPYYRVDIETRDGKRIKAVKNIRSKRDAEWVAARIRRQ